MNHRYAATAYKHTGTMVRKTRQVVMLYDGAIRFCQQARKAIEENNIQDRYNHLTRASDIILGLQHSLDQDKGGEVAKILYEYYAGLDMRLLSIHQSHDLSMLDLCIRHLKMLRDAWDEIDQKESSKGKLSGEDQALYDKSLKNTVEQTASEVYRLERPSPADGGVSVSV